MTYFVEKEASQWTFIDSFWYSLMTLTTVGYELHPKSTMGKVIFSDSMIPITFFASFLVIISMVFYCQYFSIELITFI